MTSVSSEWRGQNLWWRINGEEISDTALRQWVFRNMRSPDSYVDVIRQLHVDAYANRNKEAQK